MNYTTIISAESLMGILGAPNLCIVDCRFNLAEPGAGQQLYVQGHIPGAVYAHLDHDLAGHKDGRNGRHPLPDPEAMVARLRAWGIHNDGQVVAYDAQGGAIASRLWWLLRWLGHERVAVLDGGWPAWDSAGGEVSSELPVIDPGNFTQRPALAEVMAVAGLQAALATQAVCLLDARDPGRFRGEQEPLDPVAGHVPGARNHFFMRNLDANGRMLGADALRDAYAGYLREGSAGSVVVMCGSGVTACHDLLAMQHAGLGGAKLYAGSWSEWCSDPGRPVATSDD